MKKSMIACCSALLALAVFAEEPAAPASEGAPAPAPEVTAPKAPAPHGGKAQRGPRAPRPAPTMLMVTDKTSPEEIEAFKKQVLEKIDKSVADYKVTPAAEGEEKPALMINLAVHQRRAGRGPEMHGTRGKGPLGDKGGKEMHDRRGGHGDKGPKAKPEGEGEDRLPPPPAEESAPVPEAR